jgi:aspartate 1-decarboxylase
LGVRPSERLTQVFREMLKSKIHRATVTQSDLHYIGSLTISKDLMEAARILPNEKVDLVNLNNGARLTTYAIEGPRGTGVIGVNGAAARLAHAGDLIIIISYVFLPDVEAAGHQPAIVHVDAENRIMRLGSDPAEVPVVSGAMRGDHVAGRMN